MTTVVIFFARPSTRLRRRRTPTLPPKRTVSAPPLLAFGASHQQVDVVLAAHEHLYMRMCAMRQGKCATNGTAAPVYIIDGSGGAYSGHAETKQGFSCTQPQPPFADPTILAQDCM